MIIGNAVGSAGRARSRWPNQALWSERVEGAVVSIVDRERIARGGANIARCIGHLDADVMRAPSVSLPNW